MFLLLFAKILHFSFLGFMSYHTDELDELQSHRHHYRFTEMVYRPNHLVVTSKQSFHQTGFIFRAQYWTCPKKVTNAMQMGQRSAECLRFGGVAYELHCAIVLFSLLFDSCCTQILVLTMTNIFLSLASWDAHMHVAAIPSWHPFSHRRFSAGIEITSVISIRRWNCDSCTKHFSSVYWCNLKPRATESLWKKLPEERRAIITQDSR